MKVCILDCCCDISRAYLDALSYVNNIEVAPFEEADVICYVGCAYTRKKVFDALNDIAAVISKKRKDALLGVFGCVTKYAEFSDVVKKYSDIDYVGCSTGVDMQKELVSYLINKTKEDFVFPESGFSFKTEKRINLVVQDGCNNRCAFCKSNYLNLRNKSIPMDELCGDVDFLVDKYGITEINIEGLNPAQYGTDLYGHSKLDELIRYFSSNSQVKNIFLDMLSISDMSESLVSEILNNPKIKRVMIPIQSLDDRLLRLMRRKHSAEEAESLLTLISKERPDIFLETIFMASYPTETIGNVNRTVRFLEKNIIHNPVLSIYKYGSNDKNLFSEKVKKVTPEEYEKLMKYYIDYVIPIIDKQRQELLSKPVLGTLVGKDDEYDYFSTLYRFYTYDYSVISPVSKDTTVFEDYSLEVDFIPSIKDTVYDIENRSGRGKVIMKV